MIMLTTSPVKACIAVDETTGSEEVAAARGGTPRRIFLLSPAHAGGRRAGYLLRDGAKFELARKMREAGGAPIGEVFSFLSGLYFRGKVAYSGAFAAPPEGMPGALVITADRGLVAIDRIITLSDLREMAAVPVDAADARYRQPLMRDAAAMARGLSSEDEVILLGSIATSKYLELLADALGSRLRFPAEFAGRGDMSRGSLMLRHAARNEELRYVRLCDGERRKPRGSK